MLQKKYILPLALVVLALLLAFKNHLLFYFEVNRLKTHLVRAVPCNISKLCRDEFYSKVWAHRVDSYERFTFLSKSFSGFEVDLVYDSEKDILDVGHPPAASIGLSFERYLKDQAGRDKYFWLDVKNLDSTNAVKILTLLEKLDGLYQIKNRIIIESGYIAGLAKIAAAGYFTSFYYDTNLYEAFLKTAPRKLTDSVFSTIDAVSMDVLSYDTLLKRFPAKPRLTWALSSRYYLSDSMFSRLDKDDQLLVYLVNIKSPGYR